MASKAKLVAQNRLPRSFSVQNKKKNPKLILDKDPEQLKLSFDWWSRETVRRWSSSSNYGNLFKEMGFHSTKTSQASLPEKWSKGSRMTESRISID